MSYIESIFERANIQQIREFLFNGAQLQDTNNVPYEQRLEEVMDKAIEMVPACFPGNYEQMETSFLNATNAYEEVYMEIGLKIGMKLASEIFRL